MASIATRTGDDGTTGLLHGRRAAKTDPRIEAIGTADEVAALLAAAAAIDPALRPETAPLRDDLTALMAELAAWPDPSPAPLDAARLGRVDGRVAALEAEGIVFRAWNLDGFSPAAAQLEVARTVCRRAERRVWALDPAFLAARPLVPRYLNRLSDLLWLLARRELRAPAPTS